VPPERGILVSTIYTTTGGAGAAVASAIAGYVLTLREVTVPVVTPDAVVDQIFPAEETITWSTLIVGAMAVVAILSVLTIRAKRLRAYTADDHTTMALADADGTLG
jgi:hypothetical protein